VVNKKYFWQMRRKIAAGNWKMNLSPAEAHQLFNAISVNSTPLVVKMVFPSSIYLSELLKVKSDVIVGTQNFYPSEKGAFTGEVSAKQLSDLGVTHFLVGHSERRMLFGENNTFLKEKVDAAINLGGTVVFCCGEPLEIREKGDEFRFVREQLEESLFHLGANDMKNCIIAYEPVWAIGTGRTATSDQAEAMHAAIRSWIAEKYTAELAEQISILYGGSCNASNAKELFACPNVDGGLIGGAALVATSFLEIVDAFE
jgi:triosephosphate isomerase (TIM)